MESSPQPSGFALGLWWASQVVNETIMTSIKVSIPIAITWANVDPDLYRQMPSLDLTVIGRNLSYSTLHIFVRKYINICYDIEPVGLDNFIITPFQMNYTFNVKKYWWQYTWRWFMVMIYETCITAWVSEYTDVIQIICAPTLCCIP